MKKLLTSLVLCAFASVALAQSESAPKPPETFPGIKAVMSPEDFARAGLSGLNSEQIGLIDAAIIRHYTRTVVTAANKEAAKIVEKTTGERSRKFFDRFGLPDFTFSDEWKTVTNLKAHCTGWVGGNSFKLDNGQVWEGFEPITVDIADRDVEIAARPGGQFTLIVDGNNTTIRIHRIK